MIMLQLMMLCPISFHVKWYKTRDVCKTLLTSCFKCCFLCNCFSYCSCLLSLCFRCCCVMHCGHFRNWCCFWYCSASTCLQTYITVYMASEIIKVLIAIANRSIKLDSIGKYKKWTGTKLERKWTNADRTSQFSNIFKYYPWICCRI